MELHIGSLSIEAYLPGWFYIRLGRYEYDHHSLPRTR